MKKYKDFISEGMRLTREEFWWQAIGNSNGYDVKEILANGIDVLNMFDNKGKTALMYAALNKERYILEILLEQSYLDVNLQDKSGGWTALMYAVVSQGAFGRPFNKNIFESLILHPKIDVTIKNRVGNTFINYMSLNKKHIYVYDLQKKIIDNGRADIVLFFNKYNLVHGDIKKEYPYLFTGVDLNLL